MPGGILPGIADPLPIKLQVGTSRWGATHIQQKHGAWLIANNHSAASMVHLKLSQSGTVYTAEEEDKSKIRLTLIPSAILILKYIPNENFLSITSVYFKNSAPDGDELGRYKGNTRARAAGPLIPPVFAPPAATAPVVQPAAQPGNIVATLSTAASNGPMIVYKKKRTF